MQWLRRNIKHHRSLMVLLVVVFALVGLQRFGNGGPPPVAPHAEKTMPGTEVRFPDYVPDEGYPSRDNAKKKVGEAQMLCKVILPVIEQNIEIESLTQGAISNSEDAAKWIERTLGSHGKIFSKLAAAKAFCYVSLLPTKPCLESVEEISSMLREKEEIQLGKRCPLLITWARDGNTFYIGLADPYQPSLFPPDLKTGAVQDTVILPLDLDKRLKLLDLQVGMVSIQANPCLMSVGYAPKAQPKLDTLTSLDAYLYYFCLDLDKKRCSLVYEAKTN